MMILDFWILSAITITSGSTFFILWLTTKSSIWFQNLNIEESKTAVDALVGAVTTFLVVLWTKGYRREKWFLFPKLSF